MKQLLLAFALLTTATLRAAAQDKPPRPSLRVLDEKYGFRDARLEADTTALPGLELVSEEKNLREYIRPADTKNVGEAQLESIRYLFYKGRLQRIVLTTEGAANSQALLTTLRAQYGAGDQPSPYRQQYRWATKRVLLSFDQNASTGDGKVLLTSKVVQQAQQVDEASAAKQATGDL